MDDSSNTGICIFKDTRTHSFIRTYVQKAAKIGTSNYERQVSSAADSNRPVYIRTNADIQVSPMCVLCVV